MATNPAGLAEYQNDHDLLVQLDTKMSGVLDRLEKMDATMLKLIGDHETRIRKVETDVLTIEVTSRERDRMTRIWGTVVIVAIGVAQFIINRVWH